MPLITYLNPTKDSAKVSAYSKKVIEEILIIKSGISQIMVTSTARTAYEQAGAMYENIERHGIEHQKKLYGPYGDKVIDEYLSLKKQGKSKIDIVNAMSTKITSIGPSKISRHTGDPNKLNVVDIAPSSINLAIRRKFENAVKGDIRVSKFLTPPGDPAYHIEIPQP